MSIDKIVNHSTSVEGTRSALLENSYKAPAIEKEPPPEPVLPQRDSLEITPEATQAAKKWNEHVRETRYFGAKTVDLSVAALLSRL